MELILDKAAIASRPVLELDQDLEEYQMMGVEVSLLIQSAGCLDILLQFTPACHFLV